MVRSDSVPSSPAAPGYRVLPSASHRIVFADGSVADVREGGDVREEFSPTERRVVLVRGEAHFTVTPDASRPFLVIAGGTAVRAVGTAFNVRLEIARVEVLVTEGEIRLSDTRPADAEPGSTSTAVTAGQRAVVDRMPTRAAASARVEVTPVAPADIDQALAWQSLRLVFDRTPLDEAIDAFNRHALIGGGPRLVIGDPALRGRRLGGTFRASNADAFVRLLERGAEVRAERRGGEIVLLPAQ
jgi:transmembrane sensor